MNILSALILSVFISAAAAGPDNTYDRINTPKAERINSLPLTEITLPEQDKAEIRKLLIACADIMDYSDTETDLNKLMLRILYAQDNFKYIVGREPAIIQVDTALHMCDYSYIAEAAKKAFRVSAPKPTLSELSEYSYCYKNGYYYYKGGYDMYFATDVRDIVKTYQYGDSSYYIVFGNTYTENNKPESFEYSTAVVSKDKDGYYVKALHMGGDLSDVTDTDGAGTVKKSPAWLPISIFIFALIAAIGIIIHVILL